MGDEGKLMSLSHRLLLVALPLGVISCSSQPDENAPLVHLSKSPTGGDLVSIESDTMIDGRRARLILLCEPGKPVAFHADLVRPPANTPPARDVFAQLQAKGGPEVTVELAWMGGATWRARIPREDQAYSDTDDRNNQQRFLPILHAFSRERKLTLRPPEAYTPGGDVVWRTETMGPHLSRVQGCASLDKVPDPGE